MGVSLERVQNKFACIIGELCSEPLILSQFAVWVDLRIAEYKTKGTISLDCSGDSPNPQWMKGVKNDPPRAGPTSLDTGQGSNHRRGSYAPSSAESTLYNDRVQPPELSPRHSQNSNSQHSFSTRLSPDVMVIKSEPGADQETSCTLSRKRLSQGSDLQSDYYSPSKSRRLGNAPSTLSSAAQQESSSNQSLMSIINAENDNIVLESVDTSNADIFRSTVNASQNELDATPAFSSNTAYSPRQSAATSSGSSPSQSAWPTQYSSSQSAQGSSSQTDLKMFMDCTRALADLNEGGPPRVELMLLDQRFQTTPDVSSLSGSNGPAKQTLVAGYASAPNLMSHSASKLELTSQPGFCRPLSPALTVDTKKPHLNTLQTMPTSIAPKPVSSEHSQSVFSNTKNCKAGRYLETNRIKARPRAKQPVSSVVLHASTAVSVFENWLKEGPFQDQRKIQSLPSAELDTYLAGFFSTVKKKDGGEYSINSLLALRAGIKEHLRKAGYPVSITNVYHFPISLQAFQERKLSLCAVTPEKKLSKKQNVIF